MSRRLAELRGEVERAVLTAVAAEGLEFDRPALIRRFAGSGASTRTLHRWIAEVTVSGRAAQHLHASISAAARMRTAAHPEPAVVADIAATLPKRLPVDDVLGMGAGAVRHLETCISSALQVIQHAENADGSVRNARMMLAGAALLRRTVATAVRLAERCHALDEIEQFHKAVMGVLARQSPEIAESLLIELRRLSSQHTGKGPTSLR